MAVEVKPPFQLFTDTAGDPVDGGNIYIGAANTDPVQNPIAVFFDAALSVPAAQPIRTIGGYPSRNGSAAALFCGSNYSISVRDKNGVEVFTSASAALNGGDITLASGESLTAESGSSIDLEDGAALNIGDASGAGVVVTVAANARFAGALVPTVTGLALGALTLLWDIFARAIKVSSSILPTTAGVPSIGTTSLPFAGVVSQEMFAKEISIYARTQPSAASDLVKRTQFMSPLAACNQTSTTSTASAEELYNVQSAGITRTGPGVYTVDFITPIDGGGSGFQVGVASARDANVCASVSVGATQALVQTVTASTGSPVDAAWQLLVFGDPDQTDPIS